MKHLYLSFLLFLSFGQLFAQKDFRSGYIVQHSDTLRGQVDYRGLARSAKTTTFKANAGAAEQSFTPDQLTGFGFDRENVRYESKLVPATEAQPEQRLFLHMLVKGKASLYTYRDDSDLDRFYLSKDEAPLVELAQQVYNRPDPKTGKLYRIVDQPFKGVLTSAFFDCPDMTEKRLDAVGLTARSLSQIVIAYNTCLGAEQYIRQPRKATASFYPVLSLARPTLSMSGSHMYARGEYEHTGLGLAAGLGMEVFSPNFSEKLSMVVELLYAPYRFEGQVGPNAFGPNTSYDLLLDITYLKVPAQLRYTFPKGKIRPFANAGLTYAYAVSTERKETQTSEFHGSHSAQEREALPGSDFKYNAFGAIAGAGLLFPLGQNTLILESRYEATTGVSNILTLGSSISGISVLVGYRF
jgi:hypothetical protein